MSTGSLSDATLQYFESKGIRAILDDAMHNLVQEMPADPLAYLEEAFRRVTPTRIILTGPRGSGKTMETAKLAAHYGVAHVSAPAASVDGLEMPPEVLNQLKALQREGKGWILDGFPQTRADAIQLQTSGVSPQLVFELEIPLDVALVRLSSGNGTSSMSAEEAAAISKRYQLYKERRIELISSYKPCHRIVDGTASPEDVTAEIMKHIDALHLS